MAEKTGAGGEPQAYDEENGQYTSGGKSYRQNAGYDEILADDGGSYFLPDEVIPRSLSAKWANYDIAMPDGTVAHFVEGSKLQGKEVFAGKGCKRKIDEVERLVDQYKVSAEHWMKVKAFAVIVDEDGEERRAEVHWYETDYGDKEEIKFKKWEK